MRWFYQKQENTSSTSNTTLWTRIFSGRSTMIAPAVVPKHSTQSKKKSRDEDFDRNASIISSSSASSVKPKKSALSKRPSSRSDSEGGCSCSKRSVAFDVTDIPVINAELERRHSDTTKPKLSSTPPNMLRTVFLKRLSLDTNYSNSQKPENGSYTSLSTTGAILGSNCSVVLGKTLAIPGYDEDLTIIHKVEFIGLPRLCENVHLQSITAISENTEELLGTFQIENLIEYPNSLIVNFSISGSEPHIQSTAIKIASEGNEMSSVSEYEFNISLYDLLEEVYTMMPGIAVTKSFTLTTIGSLSIQLPTRAVTIALEFRVSKLFTPARRIRENDQKKSFPKEPLNWSRQSSV